MATRLILVEGIPGSGKTTTAGLVRDWLTARGLPARLYREGNLDHPADYESAACLSAGEYARLLAEYPGQHALLESRKTVRGEDVFLPYRKLEAELNGDPDGLVTVLARHEVYELPVERFRQVTADYWQEFAARAAGAPEVYVFECCFLQNPLTTLLAKHDQGEPAALAHMLRLAEIVRPLQPLLVYMNPPSVHGTLSAAARGRPKEWLDYVIGYITGQAWGQARGAGGFAGMVRFYEERRELELRLLDQLAFPHLVLDQAGQDWPAVQAQVEEFLGQHV